MALTIPSRTSWEDRFRTPDMAALRGAIASTFLAAFDHARTKLSHIPGACESIRWHGVWKWTIEYTGSGEGHPESFAFLVPDPARPRLCVSISDALMGSVDARKLAKAVRETLAHAPAVDGMRWATWDVATKSGVDEVVALILAYRTALGVSLVPAPPAPSVPPALPQRASRATRSTRANGVAAPGDSPKPGASAHKAGPNGTRRSRGR